MEIRIASGEELEKLLDHLALDVVDANIYHRLFRGLNEALPEHPREVAQSGTFWWLTMSGLKEAYLTRLCRVFDQHSKSLNLVNLLDTIRANRNMFDEPNFRERLKDNAFVNSLAEGVRIPDPSDIEADIRLVGTDNDVVRRLMLWRGNVHAHKAAKAAIGKAKAVEEVQISAEEIEGLLDLCFRLLNKYMGLYKAATWSRQVMGHDDYLSLLKFVRLGLEKYDADIQKEMDSWGSGNA